MELHIPEQPSAHASAGERLARYLLGSAGWLVGCDVAIIAVHPWLNEYYGSVRAQLEATGKMIGNNDLWIAAHALASNLTLVTNNEREFQRVHGLKLQNWPV